MAGNRKIVSVEKMINGGYALARQSDGKVLLVEGAYPGEEVVIRITRDKRDFAFAKAIQVLKPSPHRRRPPCKYFGVCGGCQWLDLSYDEQLRLKEEVLRDVFERADIKVDVEKIEASESEFGYRTKVEFTVSQDEDGVFLGFKKRYSHQIVRVRECKLLPEKGVKILKILPRLIEALEIDVYDFRIRRGVLKHIVIRHAFSTDQTMVIFVTKTESFSQGRVLSRKLLSRFGWITSVIHVMNSKDSVVLRGPYRTLYGEGVITEEYDWETYQIPPTAFFQSNYYVSRRLLDHVFKLLDLKGNERVVDLYSGVGFFSIRVSSAAKRVVGVESNRVSFKAAQANANVNFRKNVVFVNEDVSRYLNSIDEKFDAAIIDPPRGGVEKEALKGLIKIFPRKIVYVSCQPATLVRDVRRLVDAGYRVVSVKPFDMFPQTFHVETVALLERKD